tara:strand:+ start:8027 stop:9499 length:1473 start_codon:yes stop_codon:yes gene_type:complete
MAVSIKLKNTLLWRLSLVFFSLLLIVGLSYVLITSYYSRKYYQETTQRLNAHVADHLLEEVWPFENGQVKEEAVGEIMHSMMAVNPSLEVYLIDPQGKILSHVVLDKKVRLKTIDLTPVEAFIATGGEKYILGDDPRNPGKKAVFSATEVKENGQLLGYVYLVLASEEYEHVSGTLWGSYMLQIGTRTFLVTLIAAFVIGLLLIAFLTRNLRKIQKTVRRFEEGHYEERIPVSGSGELSELAHTFNHMADTILENIDQLKEVDKLRRDLIANVSHDLRSPMSVIHGYIETLILKEGNLSEAERKKYLDIILQSSNQLKKLVADLFELSRLEAKQIKLQAEPFCINELLQDTVLQYELTAQQKKLEVELDFSEKLPRVEGDIALIGRVIQNLLDNALKYTPEHGTIKISAQQVKKSVEIEIINTGEGIPQEDLPNIFNRYFMANQKENGQSSSGLGLAIVKKILDMHHSVIEVRSVLHQETRFTFRLPVTE